MIKESDQQPTLMTMLVFFTNHGTDDFDAGGLQEGDFTSEKQSQSTIISPVSVIESSRPEFEHPRASVPAEIYAQPQAELPAELHPKLPTAILLNIQCMNPSAISNSKWKLPYLYNCLIHDNENSSFPIIALTGTC